ncbi:MAG: 2OG-Fe(II) oxygenase [Azospirillaceae bacterium]
MTCQPLADPAVSLPQGLAIAPGALDEAECGRLVTFFEAARAAGAGRDGGLAGGAGDAGIRRSEIVWLTDGPETGWLVMRMAELAGRLNREVFGFTLSGFDEEFQIARYGEASAGFYDWHVDRAGRGAAARRRKLSISIQLSPPDAYEGGALEFNLDGHVRAAPREAGTAVAFPAWGLHRVAPVTRGRRDSLVTWLHGPDFA